MVSFEPPRHIFKYGVTETTQVTRERQAVPMVERIESPEEGGIYLYSKGFLFPSKGWPTPQAAVACNNVKRYLIGQIRFFGLPQIALVIVPIALIFKQVIRQWHSEFCMYSIKVLQPYILRERYYTNFSKQIRVVANTILHEFLGQTKGRFGEIFATLIEYDQAYRYRLEDIFSETTQEKMLANPRKEVKRLAAIFAQREPKPHLTAKITAMARLLSIALLFPKFKRAFKKAISVIDFTQLQLDEADRYYVSNLDKYQFFGIPVEARRKAYEAMHKGELPYYYEFEGDLETVKIE